ncbi:WD40-repeat-containing domain protein [Zopfochytrium polystomum]|nr:WD40-repeat-containing domain protein [Zopfochytrium polystomum]
MRAKTLEIRWHDKLPIFSIDFEPHTRSKKKPTSDPSYAHSTAPESASPARFASAGGDEFVRIWRLIPLETGVCRVEFLADLVNQFEPGVVNCVRWSPKGDVLASCGDRGSLVLWNQVLGDPGCNVNADDTGEKETWKVQKTFRGSASDMYDLAWSADASLLAVGCLDHSCLVWSVRENQCIQKITEHTYFVQGVAFDPLGKFLATQSGDSTLNVYDCNVKSQGHWKKRQFPVVAKHARADPPTSAAAAGPEVDVEKRVALKPIAVANGGSPAPCSTVKEKVRAGGGGGGGGTQRLFHDDSLPSFFRRLSFSPDGAVLVAPAGLHWDPADASRDSPGSDVKPKNVVHVFGRGDICRSPILHLPGFKKPPVAVRFNPRRYAPREDNTSRHAPLLELPYRLIFAVVSKDAIAIYDTSQTVPLAVLGDMHYGTLTDVSWSPDGLSLLVSSTDGFCSAVIFTREEFGHPFASSEPDADDVTSMDVDAEVTLLQDVTAPIAPDPSSPFEKNPAAHSSSPSSSAAVDAGDPARSECLAGHQQTPSEDDLMVVEPGPSVATAAGSDAGSAPPKRRRIAPTFVGPLP